VGLSLRGRGYDVATADQAALTFRGRAADGCGESASARGCRDPPPEVPTAARRRSFVWPASRRSVHSPPKRLKYAGSCSRGARNPRSARRYRIWPRTLSITRRELNAVDNDSSSRLRSRPSRGLQLCCRLRPAFHAQLPIDRDSTTEELERPLFVATLATLEQHAAVVVPGVGERRASAHLGVHRDRVLKVSGRLFPPRRRRGEDAEIARDRA
jgi:hypothetical protein